MNIGNLKLDSQLILAPMNGVNCAAFRLMCKEAGAGLVSTPMIDTSKLLEDSEKLISRLCFLTEERPISAQLVGSDPNEMKQATELITPHADIINLNLGCPEKDIIDRKAGAHFSKHPDKIEQILTPIINNTNLPVTAKIRIGWDEKSVNTKEVIKILNDLGVAAIAIHARTKDQGYAGKADWSEIKTAKEISNVPIIGNGDVFKPGTAQAMINATKCDFVMIGRATMGDPSIFRRADHLLKKGTNLPELTEKEKLAQFFRFAELYQEKEKMRSFTEFRQHAMWFTKGIKSSRSIKNKLMDTKTPEEILNIYKKLR